MKHNFSNEIMLHFRVIFYTMVETPANIKRKTKGQDHMGSKSQIK